MGNVNGIEKEKLFDKMRDLKEKRQTSLIEQDGDEKEQEITIHNVKYLGKINIIQEIDGQEVTVAKDIYIAEEEIDGHMVKKIYTQDMDCLAIYDNDFEIVLEKSHFEDRYIIEQIENKDIEGIIDLDDLEEQRLELLARTLGVDVKDLKRISEIDLEKDIDKQLEIESREDEELDEEESQKIVNGKQEIDLDVKVDDKYSLGQKLDLNSSIGNGDSDSRFTKIAVVETDKVQQLSEEKNLGNSGTRYSFVALRADGTAKIINDVLELDMESGSNPSKDSIKVDADGTARKDKSTLSRYKIKGREEFLSVENGNYGEIKVYYGKGKTRDGNMNVETQLETTNVRPTPIEIRELQKDEKGIYNNDKIQEEAEKCFDKGEEEVPLENADGNETTKEHMHVEDSYIQMKAEEIYNQNEEISDVFSLKEVKGKLGREIESKKESFPIEQIIEDTKRELKEDAGRFQTRGERP